ncbi:MAG: aspartate kinase [Negativicutes bacterium]|nr:aspartate kinase [Negativicutes bacterium]
MLAVLKFGGSSVADTKKIQTIATYLKERTAKGEKLIVVVSAMGKTTDALLSMAQNLSNSPNKRELDQLLAVGEQTTIALLAISLNQLGVKSQSFTGAQAGIHTNSVHTKGKIDQIDNTRLLQAFQEIDIAVVAGFQGIDELGNTTTLGRGGSDTTAVALAGAFEVKAEIYTDVEGVYRTDPRIYSNAKKIEKISYDEMMEMSALGAKIMEMRSVELGKKYNVPIYVGKTLSTEGGTWIMSANESMEQRTISAATLQENILSVSISNFSNTYQGIATIFEILGTHHINVDMITFDDSSLTFTLPLSELSLFEEVQNQLLQLCPEIEINCFDSYSKVSVVGLGMRDTSGVTGELLSLFAKNNIPFHQITTSEISISFTVNKEQAKEMVCKICEHFQL